MDTTPNASNRSTLEYQVGEAYDGQKKIKIICGQTDEIAIYITEDGNIYYDIDNENTTKDKSFLYEIVSLLNYQIYKIKTHVKSDEKRYSFLWHLGTIFFTAFNTNEKKYFANFEQDLEKYISNQFFFSYAIASGLSFILLSLITYIIFQLSNNVSEELYLGLTSGIFGALGALVSVIQRSTGLTYSKVQTRNDAILHGLIRVFLGLIFGILLYIMLESNIILGFYDGENKTHLTWLLAFLAGFSERLIPEVLNSIEKNHLSSNKTKNDSIVHISKSHLPTDKNSNSHKENG